jgi:hypothetical protein
MHGFEWKDVRGQEGTGFVRALRTVLTSQLPDLIPNINEVITNQLKVEIEKNGRDRKDSTVHVYETCKRIVTMVNCSVFFGEAMTNDVEFFAAAHQFPHDSAYAAEFIRLLPRSISGMVARFATGNFKAAAIFHYRLAKEIRSRLDARTHGRGDDQKKVCECLQ